MSARKPIRSGRLKVLAFLDHSVVIRHFVHSGVLPELAARHDLTVVLPAIGNKRLTVPEGAYDLGPVVKVIRLSPHPDRHFWWRRLFQVDKLRWRPGQQFKVLRRHLRWTVGNKAWLMFLPLSLPGIFQIFRAWVLGRIARMPDEVGDLVRAERPDVLLHPTVMEGPYLNDLISVSEDERVPLVLIMNSWDNPSTKRMMIGRPDLLLVWGEQTRAHAINIAGVPSDSVEIFGAAQFELFRTPPRVDRAAYCQLHDLDPSAPLVLYAGSSRGADEFRHLVSLEEAIASGALPPATIIYRPHPWGAGGREGGRLLQRAWSHVFIDPAMRSYLESVVDGKASDVFPDYRDTHDLLSVTDVLVTPLSTIGIEAALHGKPVLIFLPVDETGSRRFEVARPLIHFSELLAHPEFLSARGLSELVEGVMRLIGRSCEAGIETRMKSAAASFVETFERPYVERLDDRLRQIARRPQEGTQAAALQVARCA